MIVFGALFIHAVYAPGVIFATAVGHPGVVAINNAFVCVLTIVLCEMLVAPFGTLGAAASVAIPVLAVFPISQFMTTRCTGLPYWRPLAFSFSVLGTDVVLCLLTGFVAGPGSWGFAAAVFIVGVLAVAGLWRSNRSTSALVGPRQQ